MPDEIKIEVNGLPELQAKLLALGQDMGAQSIVSSAYTANKKMEDAIKAQITANGQVRTGLLRDSIARKKVIFANTGTVAIVTGVSRNTHGTYQDKKGKIFKIVPWRYAHIVEKRKSFLETAAKATSGTVVDAFITSLARKIKKYTT